ncbi:MAG: hypothetical protein JXA54_02820 [Candidatus Heimdallarchaeota archaeon]|nr:hypothetical protein [Candidatus Heimdallarchaeota archaeon]
MNNPQDTSSGTLSLVFGIIGCVGILPCIGAILAIIFGSKAKGTAGESSGKIGRILGWIGICWPLIGLAIYIILVFVLWGGVWIPTLP